MNILDIKYCAQNLRFHEEAYQQFAIYEEELKKYFLSQADGHEIFEDLQLRICEMFQAKMAASGDAISISDVVSIKQKIGEINQLEREVDDFGTTGDENTTNKQASKRLYRSENEKMLGGVCGGLGNYFSIDPLAFRLLFALVTIMTKGFGLLVYIIFWIALKLKHLPPNLSKRLYRNSSDRVIAGVCGGLASFFKTEAWIIRLLFLSPIILNVTMDGFFDFGFTIFNGSAMGFVIIAYIVLWITTKESQTPTEELLSRGEDITLNNIAEEKVRVQNASSSNSTFNAVLRVLAFIMIGLLTIPIIAFLGSLTFASVFMMPLTSSVLHTPLLKWLGVLSVLFFIVLPLVAFVVWGIRRISGIKGPNTALRLSFGSLWALGIASAITLSALLLGEMNKKSDVENRSYIPVAGDTLYVHKLDDQFMNTGKITSRPLISNFYEEEENEHRSHLVSISRGISPNDSFYIQTKITALGKGESGAGKNAQLATYRTEFYNNELYLAQYLGIPKKEPYRFQHAKITILVPRGKRVIIDKGLHKFDFGKNGIVTYNGKDWDELDEDERIEVEETFDEVDDELDSAMDEVNDAISEVSKELEKVANNLEHRDARPKTEHYEDVDLEIRKAEQQAEANIELEKQKLRLKKEQLKLEKLKQGLREQ